MPADLLAVVYAGAGWVPTPKGGRRRAWRGPRLFVAQQDLVDACEDFRRTWREEEEEERP
jgi:hypothetical protein